MAAFLAARVLHHYLRAARDDLIWKLDELGERDARRPRTQTGNNLLGVLKHCLNVEAGYFGPTFGREFPTPEELVPFEAYEADPQADWYAREDETKAGLVDLLQRIIVHVIADLARHAGHADIMRETHDGAIGWQRDNSNVPDDYDWPGYVARLTGIADRYA